MVTTCPEANKWNDMSNEFKQIKNECISSVNEIKASSNTDGSDSSGSTIDKYRMLVTVLIGKKEW
jgi:hypothetical protein